MADRPKVFVITPFSENFLALYKELKHVFARDFDFSNAGDLDNQQNILKDIVEGIYQADVVIADLTGLNPNVFYELGLSHAMNKKVIIITQNIVELPFDIKSYRANEYSLQFNKLPLLIDELKRLLYGAIDNSVKYGNPVSDYIPDFYEDKRRSPGIQSLVANDDVETLDAIEEDTKGFLDCIADIGENSAKMSNEINSMGIEMNEMTASVSNATRQIQQAKSQNGSVDVVFVRNICRRLAVPIETFARKLKEHVSNIHEHWRIVENSYLALLDNQHAQQAEKLQELEKSMRTLRSLQEATETSNKKIEGFAVALRGGLGMEKRLNKAVSLLDSELGAYLSMTETMMSSIDRILSKGAVVIDALKGE